MVCGAHFDPIGETGDVVVWHIQPNVLARWIRRPLIGYNQVGYTPGREKVAVIELDPLFDARKKARVLRLTPQGQWLEAFSGEVRRWGKWMRYEYASFDFSAVRDPGMYAIEYAGQRTGGFRIAPNVYDGIWNLSLNTYLPEQMDHVKVREGYRTWHGASHPDDARQAALNYTHFDGYNQGPTTDSPFVSGQHIPGLNVGGWYDAGDFEIAPINWSEAAEHQPSRAWCGSRERHRESAFDAGRRQTVDNPDRLTG